MSKTGTLINTLKARDLATEQHASRLEKLLVRMAALIGLPESATADLSFLAKFHDIGKVGISDAILLKEGPFTPEEWAEMKRHCEMSGGMVRGILSASREKRSPSSVVCWRSRMPMKPSPVPVLIEGHVPIGRLWLNSADTLEHSSTLSF